MLDQRYYIITIMALFISLTLGIFIGNALLGNDLVIVQQQEVIEQLRQNYYKLQEENRCLQEQFRIFQVWEETNRDLEELILSLLKERTKLRPRLIIFNTSGRELDADLTDFLREFGFAVSAICTIADCFTPEDEALQALVQGGREQGISDRKWQELVSYLAEALAGDRTTEFLQQLSDRRYITLTGSPAAGADVALLIGGAGEVERIDRLDKLLIGACQKEGVRVIVGARAGSGSILEAYRGHGVSTIGHLDTSAGRLSLFYLLSSGQEGHFGPDQKTSLLLPHQWLREQVEGG